MARYGLVKTGVMRWRIVDLRSKPYKGKLKTLPGSYNVRDRAITRLNALNTTAAKNDDKRERKSEERSLEHWQKAQTALDHGPSPIRQYKDD